MMLFFTFLTIFITMSTTISTTFGFKTCQLPECVPLQQSTNPPIGIQIVLSDATTWEKECLDDWLTNICDRNERLQPKQQMTDLIVRDIAIQNKGLCNDTYNYTILYDLLDIISPYFPGGSKQCFTNLFIGTMGSTRMGPSKYKDPDVDWSNEIATAFKNKYPNTSFNWFVSIYRPDISTEISSDTKTNELCTLLSDWVEGLIKVQSSSKIMWLTSISKSFSKSSTDFKSKIKEQWNKLFTTIKRNSGGNGINYIEISDPTMKMGCTECSNFESDVTDSILWYRFFRNSYSFDQIRMGMAYYKFKENCELAESDVTIQIEREEAFGGAGDVRIGSAYEIKYWRERNIEC